MAFVARDFSVLAYANGFTLWHYRTEDPPARLLGLGGEGAASAANDNDDRLGGGGPGGGSYFAPAGEMLRAGDEIKVNFIGPDGTDLAHFVVANISPAGAVDVRLIGASLSRPMNVASAA